jgi:hypothetical protein
LLSFKYCKYWIWIQHILIVQNIEDWTQSPRIMVWIWSVSSDCNPIDKAHPYYNSIDKAYPDQNPIDKAYPDQNPKKERICRSKSEVTKRITLQSIPFVSADCGLHMLCFCGLWSGYALSFRIMISICFVSPDCDLDMLCFCGLWSRHALFLWIVIWICFVSVDCDLDMLCFCGLTKHIQIMIRKHKA